MNMNNALLDRECLGRATPDNGLQKLPNRFFGSKAGGRDLALC
jgi:hypothetical protein